MHNTTLSTDPFGILEGPSPSEALDYGEDEQELVSNLYYRIEAAEQARKAHEADWEYNRFMLLGEQLIVKRANDTEVLRAVESEDALRRYTVDNELRTSSRAFVGKMTRLIPGAAVLPATGDREDLLAAEVRESYLRWFTEHKELRKLYKRAHEAFPWNGTGVFQLLWDPDGGRELAWCEQCAYTSETLDEGEPCPTCSAEAEMQVLQMQQQAQMMAMQGIEVEAEAHIEVPTMKKVREGEVDVRLLDTRNFFPEPGIPELKDMNWAYTKRAIHIGKLRKMFPERGISVSSEIGIYDDRWVSYTGSLLNAQVQTHYLDDHVNLIEFHVAPSGEHPDGQLIYMAAGRILHRGPNPYIRLLGRLPFYALRSDLKPGEFWGEAQISQQAHLQRDLNHLLSQRRDFRSMSLNPRVVVEQGSGISAEDFTASRPGHVIIKKRNANDPRYMEIPGLPSHVYAEGAEYRQSIRQKQGVTEQEMGLGGGNLSGRSAAFAAAQSSEMVSPYMIENIPEWMQVYKGVLMLAEVFDNPEKRWMISGEDTYHVHSWSMIGSSNPGWDVVVADEDSLSQNPTLRRQEAMELLQLGVFTDAATGVPDMKSFMRAAGLKLPGAGIDIKTNEHTYAAQIPERIARGEEVVPELFDDANVMAEELLTWLRGRGRMADPALKQRVQALWEAYAMAMVPATPLDQEFQPNPGMQQMLNPTPPGPGVAPDGTPQRPMGPPTEMGTGPLPQQPGTDAGQLIAQADASAEQMVRGNQPHEG